jgi:DNA-binding CsgD family transcriptional regulator
MLLAKGEGPGHDDEPTIVRGRHARLDCQRVGDEVVVVIRRSEIAETTGTERITPREREVLALVARGQTSREVAATLHLRPSTVRTHMEHAMRRLGVKTRAEAVGRALATGQLKATSA